MIAQNQIAIPDIFAKLLKLAGQGEFFYRYSLFRQKDGVPMGSPLALTSEKRFLALHVRNWLDSDNSCIKSFQ